MKILLNTLAKVRKFSEIVNLLDYGIDLARGRYIVPARSLMGIFSFDLEKPIDVICDDENKSDLKERIHEFLV